MGAKGPLWERIKHFDGEIPLFRERETRKMKESIIYVHGKGGSAEEADHYKPLFPNCEVIGFDYRPAAANGAMIFFPGCPPTESSFSVRK